VYANARKYRSALEAALDANNVPTAVYHNMITAVNKHLPALHRYLKLRQTLLGLPDLQYHDMYPPIVKQVEMKYSYEEARQLLARALEPMGKDYVDGLVRGLDPSSGWVDVYPNQGKRSGAYMDGSAYQVHPFVLVNFLDNYNSVSTLAHEMGHAAHSWFSMKHQPTPQWGYAGFLAEIASTANEALLLDHLLANTTDPDQRIFLLNARVDSIKGTIYRQAMLSEFDLAVHTFVEQGTPVTAELLDQTWRELVQRYYGPDYVLDADDGMEWAYIRHFYYKYYLYTYATGLSSGLAIADRVRNGGPDARGAYLGMLEAGASAPPVEILKGAGVDLTTPAPIEAAMKVFDESLTELERLLDERAAREAARPAVPAE